MILLVVDVLFCDCIVFYFVPVLKFMLSATDRHFISVKFSSLPFGRQIYLFIYVKEWDSRVIAWTCI